MEFCVCFDTVFFFLSVGALSVHAACTLRKFKVWIEFHALCRLLREYTFWFAKKDDALAALVRKNVTNRILRDGKASLRPVAHVTFFWLIAVVVNRSVGRQKAETLLQDSVLLVALISSILSYSFPHYLSVKTMGAYYHYMMALSAIYGATSTSYHTLLGTFTFSFICRSAISIVFKDVPKLMFWNVVCITLACFSFVRDGRDVEFPPIDLQHFAMLQAAVAIILTVFVHLAYKLTVRSVRQELECGESTQVNMAIRSLLDMVFDVTLELDDQLEMVSDCRALSALLGRGLGTSLKGRPFEDFIATPEDKLRFSTHMSSLASELSNESRAQVTLLHFSMKDGNGGLIDAEMFSTSFRATVGELRHFVGIREFSDHLALAHAGRGSALIGSIQRTFSHSPNISNREDLCTSMKNEDVDVRRCATTQSTTTVGWIRSGGGSTERRSDAELSHEEVLAAPSFAPTTEKAIFAAMQLSISHVNWKLQRQSCCRRHAYLSQANKYFKALYHDGCCDDFASVVDTWKQCKKCGLLHEVCGVLAAGNSWRCYVCGMCDRTATHFNLYAL